MGVQVPSPALEKKLAGLAQLVEHLICNQRVACSSHVAGILCERSSVVEHHLAKVGVAGSNPVVRLRSRGGGTGRRTGLKILRGLNFVPVRFRSAALQRVLRNQGSFLFPEELLGSIHVETSPFWRVAVFFFRFFCVLKDPFLKTVIDSKLHCIQ